MATNLTIEAPNFEKIRKESGQFTHDAIRLLWAAFNDTRDTERRDFRLASEQVAPKVLHLSPSGSTDNLDLDGSSVVSFEGGSGQNLTGIRAPETGKTRIAFIHINGAGTITCKHNATSETANQLVLSTGADTARATNTGIIFVYLQAKWREVART